MALKLKQAGRIENRLIYFLSPNYQMTEGASQNQLKIPANLR